MKKVKIMLMSVLAIAVVAGAFAFKAQKLQHCVFTAATDSATPGTCTLATGKTTTDASINVNTTEVYYFTTLDCVPPTNTIACTTENSALVTTKIVTAVE